MILLIVKLLMRAFRTESYLEMIYIPTQNIGCE